MLVFTVTWKINNVTKNIAFKSKFKITYSMIKPGHGNMVYQKHYPPPPPQDSFVFFTRVDVTTKVQTCYLYKK